MMKWTLVLAAALLVPSVAHAQDELGTCYSDLSCTGGDEIDHEVAFEPCMDEGGLSWWGNGDDSCTPAYIPLPP